MEKNDVHEEAVHLLAVARADFAQVRLDVILVVGMEEVEKFPRARLGCFRVGRSPVGKDAVAAQLQPLGVTRRGVLFPGNRRVDGRADARAVERLDLFAEQVAPAERRVWRPAWVG